MSCQVRRRIFRSRPFLIFETTCNGRGRWRGILHYTKYELWLLAADICYYRKKYRTVQYMSVPIPGIRDVQWFEANLGSVKFILKSTLAGTIRHCIDCSTQRECDIRRTVAMIAVPPLKVFLEDGPSSAKCPPESEKGTGHLGKYLRRIVRSCTTLKIFLCGCCSLWW